MSRLNELLSLLTQYITETDGNFEEASQKLMIEGYTPSEIDAALEWNSSIDNVRYLETERDEEFNNSFRVFTYEEDRLLDKSAKAFIIDQLFSKRIDIVILEELFDKLRLLEIDSLTADDLKSFIAVDGVEFEDEMEIKTKIASIH